jgi:hypothetical protein
VLEQCRTLGVAPFIKQLGRRPVANGRPIKLIDCAKGAHTAEWPRALRVREFPLTR